MNTDTMTSALHRIFRLLAALAACCAITSPPFSGQAGAQPSPDPAAMTEAPQTPPTPKPSSRPEVRGTWLTTTGNDAISTPERTEATMKRLREIGMNTVYVEAWKNGYTQFPSAVLQRTIGVDRRPALMKQDPSDTSDAAKAQGRDLLGESVLEAHRQGLVCIAWFEYGFMAAHKDTDNHLRRMKKEWLSLDQSGNEVAPNGFVWMNPLHPEARRFLLDLILEAVDKYDLDGVQLDDRIVWPHVTMGYDSYTKQIYAAENDGKEPPADHKDPAWIRWRADKVNECAKMFVQEIRAKRPGLLISVSPAVYPWVYDNYCLEWPKWAAWTAADAIDRGPTTTQTPWPGTGITPRWDEFVPQCYRFSYDAFEKTWREQIKWLNELGGSGHVGAMHAGIRVVGEGPNATWEDVRRSIDLVRETGGGGHVLWFSRGVLDVYPTELTALYRSQGPASHPYFAAKTEGDWRPIAIPLIPTGKPAPMNTFRFECPPIRPAEYLLIARENGVRKIVRPINAVQGRPGTLAIPPRLEEPELLLDRRPDLARVR